jgi:drug/metabolite transporter (DMT)-like permease
VSTVLNRDTGASPGRTANPRRLTGIGLLVPACISWGLSTALTKIVLEQLTPVDLFGIEIVVSAVPLALLALVRGARPGRPSPVLLLLGVLEPGLTYLLFDLGVQRTAASHAALLLALDAPATLLLAVAFLRERVDPLLVASLALGVGGTILVTWHAGGPEASLAGDVLVIGSALTGAAYGVLARHVAPSRDVVVVTAVQMLGALSVAVPVFAVSVARGASSIGSADGAHLALAVAVGLLGGVIPFLLFNRAIARVTALQAGLILVLVPVVGAGASVVLLAERISGLAASGSVLALAGATLAALRTDEEPPITQATVTPVADSTETHEPTAPDCPSLRRRDRNPLIRRFPSEDQPSNPCSAALPGVALRGRHGERRYSQSREGDAMTGPRRCRPRARAPASRGPRTR